MSKNYFLSNFFPSRSRNFLPQIEAQCLQMLLVALFLHSSTTILGLNCYRLISLKVVIGYLGGRIAQWIDSVLALHTAAPGLILGVPR